MSTVQPEGQTSPKESPAPGGTVNPDPSEERDGTTADPDRKAW